MISSRVVVISRLNPLQYLAEKPALVGRLARWLLLLTEFHLEYVTQKFVKGRVIADYLAENPTGIELEEDYEFPDEHLATIEAVKIWEMYFDGAANRNGRGAGVVLVSPGGLSIPLALRLNFPATNNAAEYEALIFGLKALVDIGVDRVSIYGDSLLVISQTTDTWEVREPNLQGYKQRVEQLRAAFTEVNFFYIPRVENAWADSLASLASSLDQPLATPIIIRAQDSPSRMVSAASQEPDDGKPWYYDIRLYVEKKEFATGSTPEDQRTVVRLSSKYLVCGNSLYRRSYEGVLLLCVTEGEAKELMEQVHGGECGPHMGGKMLVKKIMRLGYFWSTMEADCADFVRRCERCQKHGDFMKRPVVDLHSLSSPWPFATWGLDIIGKIHPTASNGHEFILVAIDYFTKWVEAESFKTLKAKQVAQFIKKNLVCRFGVPSKIITDNGSQFGAEVDTLLKEYDVQHHRSSPYRPQTNGAVEAANKNIKNILSKMIEQGRDWSEKLPLALWAYRTSIRVSTGTSPFSLVYGAEAVLPVELQVRSTRVLIGGEIEEEEYRRLRNEELELLDERRLIAMSHMQGYQRRIARAFNKKIKSRGIKAGDLVLKEILASTLDPRGKFRPKWSGPYIVRSLTKAGAAWISDLDGNGFSAPVNLDKLKRFYQ